MFYCFITSNFLTFLGQGCLAVKTIICKEVLYYKTIVPLSYCFTFLSFARTPVPQSYCSTVAASLLFSRTYLFHCSTALMLYCSTHPNLNVSHSHRVPLTRIKVIYCTSDLCTPQYYSNIFHSSWTCLPLTPLQLHLCYTSTVPAALVFHFHYSNKTCVPLPPFQLLFKRN